MKKFELNYNNLCLYIFDKNNEKDYEYIKQRKREIFTFFKNAYDNIGGCTVFLNEKSMLNRVVRYKIIMDEDQNLYAISVYQANTINKNYKCMLVCGLRTDIGKESVKYIIKSDILNFKHLYWIEASGAIGHWQEKYGAIKIPNIYVYDILNKENPTNKSIEITLNEEDSFKYSRNISSVGLIEKTMFGFNSEETLNKILTGEQIDLYEKQLEKLLPDCSTLHESENNYNIILGLYATLNFIYKSYTEKNQFCNITQKMSKNMFNILKYSNKLIQTNEIPNNIKKQFVDLYNKCLKIYKQSNILTIHKYY